MIWVSLDIARCWLCENNWGSPPGCGVGFSLVCWWGAWCKWGVWKGWGCSLHLLPHLCPKSHLAMARGGSRSCRCVPAVSCCLCRVPSVCRWQNKPFRAAAGHRRLFWRPCYRKINSCYWSLFQAEHLNAPAGAGQWLIVSELWFEESKKTINKATFKE